VSYTKVPNTRARNYSSESTEVESKCLSESEGSQQDLQADNEIDNEITEHGEISEESVDAMRNMSAYSHWPLRERL